MKLFEFAETADDSELHNWMYSKNTTSEQYDMLRVNFDTKQTGLLLWTNVEDQFRNNMSYEEARMFMMFVALATGEQP